MNPNDMSLNSNPNNMRSSEKADSGIGDTVGTTDAVHITGNVDTGGGDFVGRDQTIQGDVVQGDVVHGDKVIIQRLDPADARNQCNHAVLRQMVRSFWIDGVLKSSRTALDGTLAASAWVN